MNEYKKILAALDLGADTGRILAYAVWLARSSDAADAEINMLHVMDYAFTPPPYMLPYMEKERETSGTELLHWVEKLKEYGARATYTIASGRLVETFISSARDLNADAIVLGHKSHLVRPSSSERLIRSLDAPVLVVRGKKAESASPGSVSVGTIVCVVDFSENSRRALAVARSLAENNSSKLIMAHVVSVPSMEEGLKKLKDASDAERDTYKAHVMSDAEENICSFIHGCTGMESIVRTGVPYKAINEIAVEKDADLIIMGARGMSLLKGILLGGVSESVTKSSPCPVMLVR